VFDVLTAGLKVGLLAAATSLAPIDYSVQVDHQSGPISAVYRSTVAVRHNQVGAVAPGGKPSTLRCRWSVNLIVDRQARAASGTMMTRNMVREGVVSGSRPGWCDTQRKAIAQDVATQLKNLDRHVVVLAQEDQDVLRAELDRLHGATRAG